MDAKDVVLIISAIVTGICAIIAALRSNTAANRADTAADLGDKTHTIVNGQRTAMENELKKLRAEILAYKIDTQLPLEKPLIVLPEPPQPQDISGKI